jgi:peroxiredoxin Q/BCP
LRKLDGGIDKATCGRHASAMLVARSWALACAALMIAAQVFACGPAQRPDGGSGLLAVGAQAPDFAARDPKGAEVRLSQARGQLAVVYFYPKDETPGCTKQACAFRDKFEHFGAAGVAVFGVSRDSQKSHDAFRAHHSLPFALAADESGDIQGAYGVPSKLPGVSARVTFLVDRQGKVARVWPEVDPVLNVAEVLDAARRLGQPS